MPKTALLARGIDAALALGEAVSMCLGLPMSVISCDGLSATVEGWGERRVVNALLVGPIAPGTPVLVHLNNIVRILEPDEAGSLEAAIRTVVDADRGIP